MRLLLVLVLVSGCSKSLEETLPQTLDNHYEGLNAEQWYYRFTDSNLTISDYAEVGMYQAKGESLRFLVKAFDHDNHRVRSNAFLLLNSEMIKGHEFTMKTILKRHLNHPESTNRIYALVAMCRCRFEGETENTVAAVDRMVPLINDEIIRRTLIGAKEHLEKYGSVKKN